MKITIKDLAKEAGVSYQTVSKALRGTGSVNAETVARIRQLASARGYVPNRSARAMTTRKSQLVAVFLPQIASSFYNKILQGFENIVMQHDYSLLLYLFENANITDKLETLLAYQVEGIVIFENHFSLNILNRFKANNIPLLFVNSTEMPADANQIAIDGYYGLKLAFEHLHALGHRHLLLAHSDHEAEMKRIEEIKKVPAEYHLKLTTRIYCDHYASQEVLASFDVNDLPKGITGIVCTSDYIALPIMSKLHAAARAIPRDISIIGFDDLEFAAFLNPPLTTIEQPKRDFGEKIAQTLFGLLRGDANQRVTIFPKLIVRGTTASVH